MILSIRDYNLEPQLFLEVVWFLAARIEAYPGLLLPEGAVLEVWVRLGGRDCRLPVAGTAAINFIPSV